ncbi:MAG: hypothetical protein PHU74_02210, partial [Candidatus Pacebacteria bacterium]|nr:hypothetical protein [Candidatus Paceibacterota bacterium]
MDKYIKNKNLLIALFIIACLFIISLKNNAIKVEAAEEEGFKVKYYKDEGLTQEIQSDSKLKEGDYYIKIDKKGKIVPSVNISIDAEGVLNDVNNAKASQINTNGFKYKRTISYDEDAKGIEPEKILINNSDVLDKENSIYYTDTILPKLKFESHTNGNVDTYKLISDESLSYIKIELSSDIYAILYKGMYKSSFSGDCYGWHMKAKKGWITLTNIDIFKDKNNFSLYLGDASITITKNEDDSEFTIDMTGDIAEQVRKQKSVPLLVRDDAENELEGEFKIPVSLKKELGIFEFKKYIVRDSGIYAEYELKNSKGEAVDLKELVEIKRKLKEGISFETVQDFILPIQDKGDFVYSILFKDVEYTAEISSQGVIDVSINKTGNAKEIDGNIYYEYIVPGIDFTDITLYQFGEENKEILINDLNLYFNQEKEGFFIYYFKKLDDWYKFTINFEKDTVPAPSLKSFSFNLNKENKISYSFEIASTGHKDIYVSKAILNIFDQDGNIVLDDVKQGSFEKDIPYVFELDSSKLEKGKMYHYSIILLNASKTYESDKTYFTTKPGDVSNINITKIDTNKIKLSFDKG